MNIIVDLDGTLANNRHRLHYIYEETVNWDAFFSEMSLDTVNAELDMLLSKLNNSYTMPYNIYIITGRPETYRSTTEQWLDANTNFYYKKLLMRENKNRDADFKLKGKLYDSLNLEGLCIAFEDSELCADMYSSKGVMVFRPHTLNLNMGFDENGR